MIADFSVGDFWIYEGRSNQGGSWTSKTSIDGEEQVHGVTALRKAYYELDGADEDLDDYNLVSFDNE